MQPPRIAIGPEPSQQIPQNQHAGPAAGPLQGAAQRRLRRRQPDRRSTRNWNCAGPKMQLPAHSSPTATAPSRPRCRPAPTPCAPPESQAPSRFASRSARTAAPRRTTCFCPKSGLLTALGPSARLVTIGRVTIVLAIAVLALAAALVYVVASRPEQQAPVDHGAGDPGGDLESCRRPAADQRGVAQARHPGGRGDARQAPGGDQGADRAHRQGPGEDRGGGAQARRRRPADAHPARADGSDGRQPQHRDGRPQEGAAPTADPRPVGRAAAAPLHRDRRHDRARRLRAAGDDPRPKTAACGPTPASCCPRGAASSPTPRSRSTPSSTPRRRRSSPSGASTSSATRGRRASTSARSARRTTRGSSRRVRRRIW